MAEPTPYQPDYDFTAVDKGPEFNIEFDNIALAVGETQSALAEIRRSDGKLQNGIVTGDSLAPDVVLAFSPLIADQIDIATTSAQTAASAAGTAVSARNEAQGHAQSAEESAELAASVASSRTCLSVNKNSVAQSGIPTSTFTKVTFGTKLLDDDAAFNVSNSRWTPAAGRYRVSCSVLANGSDNAATDARRLALYKNGTLYRQALFAPTTASTTVSLQTLVDADGDDYFEIFFHSANTTVLIEGTPSNTWLEAEAV